METSDQNAKFPDPLSAHRVSRAHFSIVDLGEEDVEERDYWLSRSVEELLEQMEYLRYINYGDPADRRFQRFFEIVDFPQS